MVKIQKIKKTWAIIGIRCGSGKPVKKTVKIEILIKSPFFVEKRNCCQKSKFWLNFVVFKIKILLKVQLSVQNRFFFQN